MSSQSNIQMINVADLKRKTDSVLAAKKERERLCLLEIKGDDGATEAAKIIKTIEAVCQVAAESGKYSAVVMRLMSHEPVRVAGHDLHYTLLKGASRRVWNFCQSNKLNPKLIQHACIWMMHVGWDDEPVAMRRWDT